MKSGKRSFQIARLRDAGQNFHQTPVTVAFMLALPQQRVKPNLSISRGNEQAMISILIQQSDGLTAILQVQTAEQRFHTLRPI